MKKVHALWVLACLLAAPVLFQSCSDDDDEVYVWYPYLSPNALVTVKGGTDSCFLQLDDETTLWPVNLSSSPFGEKEVRSLVYFTDVDGEKHFCTRAVYVNWMDSILTKKTVPDSALVNDSLYGNDVLHTARDFICRSVLLEGGIEGFNQASAPPAWNWNPAALPHIDSADDMTAFAGRGSPIG